MKKMVLTAALCASLTAVAPTQGYAGSSAPSGSGGSSGSDAAVIVLVVALGALLFGLGNGARSKTTKKSADSQF
ncbi:hypothetical protein [Tateyamaria sp. SN6-1]|uniref:hypothetical protein n=1 Tax=Tateyamaria sp. SN6-1 TaxID=3092148 RepID=UPI0039F5169B